MTSIDIAPAQIATLDGKVADMENRTPTISLVLATIGRTVELIRFLDHLDRQTYRNFNVIVVDQNSPGTLEAILEEYSSKFSIQHVYSLRGLSRARNAGLQLVSGEVIAFPDDDCWYPPSLLQEVAAHFTLNPGDDGITGRCVSPDGQNWCKFDLNSGHIDRDNLFRRATAATMFLRMRLVANVGIFDETMGVGAETSYLCGEEMDYLLRALEHECSLTYDPGMCVYHEPSVVEHGPRSWKRARDYGCGFGYLLKKHGYSFTFRLYVVLRATAGIFISVVRCDFPVARYYFNLAMGRAAGCFASE